MSVGCRFNVMECRYCECLVSAEAEENYKAVRPSHYDEAVEQYRVMAISCLARYCPVGLPTKEGTLRTIAMK